jgi:hypothetical protein
MACSRIRVVSVADGTALLPWALTGLHEVHQFLTLVYVRAAPVNTPRPNNISEFYRFSTFSFANKYLIDEKKNSRCGYMLSVSPCNNFEVAATTDQVLIAVLNLSSSEREDAIENHNQRTNHLSGGLDFKPIRRLGLWSGIRMVSAWTIGMRTDENIRKKRITAMVCLAYHVDFLSSMF